MLKRRSVGLGRERFVQLEVLRPTERCVRNLPRSKRRDRQGDASLLDGSSYEEDPAQPEASPYPGTSFLRLTIPRQRTEPRKKTPRQSRAAAFAQLLD